MQKIERRNVVRAALKADRRTSEGYAAWVKALRALVHEQQQLQRRTTATDVMRALVSGRVHMVVCDVDEDAGAQMVIGLLQVEW